MSCGRITKLIVNIGMCQTRITYADNSTRFQMSNPSGFVFRSMALEDACPDGVIGDPAVGFLQRHFGRGGSIEKTLSLRETLFTVGLDDYANGITDHLEEQQRLREQQQRVLAKQKLQKRLEQHTWHMEQMPKVKAQRATELPRPKGQLHIFNLGWHLQSCRWRDYNHIEFQLPKCHCTKIKETMDYINELVSSALPMPDSAEPPAQQSTTIGANLTSINSLLHELNQLLELQHRDQVHVQP